MENALGVADVEKNGRASNFSCLGVGFTEGGYDQAGSTRPPFGSFHFVL